MFLLGLENRFVCLVYFRLTEDIKTKSAQLFSSPSIFVRKPLRINWPLNYTLQYVLQAVSLTERYSVFRLFHCFSSIRFQYSLFFDS